MKKYIKLSLLLVVLLLLTACGLTKNAITVDEFKEKADAKGLIVVDVKEQFAEYDHIETATVAASNKGWQIEHYTLSNNKEASKMFNKNLKIFEASKGSSSKQNNIEIGNYRKFELETNGKYQVIIKSKNIFIYVDTYNEHKDEIKDFIKELGY